jgi:hypothetical protein
MLQVWMIEIALAEAGGSEEHVLSQVKQFA